MHVDGVRREFRDEIRRPALHRVRLEGRMGPRGRAVRVALLRDPAAQELSILRLADDDLRFGPLFRQYPRDAFEGAARAISGDPKVERLSLKIFKDFYCRCPRMKVGIG